MKKNANSRSNGKLLADGTEQLNPHTASTRLLSEIEFLKERISKMNAFASPNKETLDTYEEMLKSREAVLTWLSEQNANESNSASNTG